MWKETCGLNVLVQEIFVHNSWNIQQGISHAEECVFTVRRHKPIVLLIQTVQKNPKQFAVEVTFLAGWTKIHETLMRPKATKPNCCRNIAQLQTYDSHHMKKSFLRIQ